MKYKALAKVWGDAMQGNPIDWIQYGKTMKRVSHSYITPSIEDQLAWFVDDKQKKHYCVTEILAAGGETLLPTGQSIPNGPLTIVLDGTSPDLQIFLGNSSSLYEFVEGRENNLVSYRKYRRR